MDDISRARLGVGDEPIFENKDGDGNSLRVWRGKSLRAYPADIACRDAVFYLETEGPYRFELQDQVRLMDLVLTVVVRPGPRREKAMMFINGARRHLGGQGILL